MAHAELDVSAQLIHIHSDYHERELIKMIPGARWAATGKLWTTPLTWAACCQLRGVFGAQLTIGPQLIQWATRERAERVDRTLSLRQHLSGTRDLQLDQRLFPFQVADVEFLITAGSALIGNEMGTGKSCAALSTLRYHQETNKTGLPAVIICPNSTKTNWAREANMWFPDAHTYVVNGSRKAREDILKRAQCDPEALVIINIEGVRGHSRLAPYGSVRLKKCADCVKLGAVVTTITRATQCEVHPRELNDFGFKTVIFDEAHRLKDPKAQQTRAAWAVGHDPSVVRRWALTGTPIANAVDDLWSLMHFVEPSEYPTKTAYVDRYCLQAWNGFGGLSVIGVRPEVRDEFFKILDPRFRRVTKDLVLQQLPKKMYTTIPVKMPDKQAKAYREMETGLVTRLEDGSLLIAASNLTAQVRLLQLAGATCITDIDGKVTLTDVSPKVDALEEFITGAGKPVVVAAEHKQLINIAAKRLKKIGVSYALITGDIGQWERQKALDDFNIGAVQVLLFTIKAGGTGLNMTAADTIVFLQRSWSMIDNKQAEDRVHRIGSEKHESIHVIDIIVEGTVEEDVLERYALKLRRLEELNRDREQLRAAGIDTSHLDQLEDRILNSHLGDIDG